MKDCMSHLPDDFECPDRRLLKECIFNALSGDLFYHRRIKRTLSDVGFHVDKIEKHWFFDIYEIKLRRGAAMGNDTESQLRRKIRRALKFENIDFDKPTFMLSVQGQRLICAFCFKLGAEGTI
jgi:hypothetical protein